MEANLVADAQEIRNVMCVYRTQQGESGEEQPEFLPMFPWYSGKLSDMACLLPCHKIIFESIYAALLAGSGVSTQTLSLHTDQHIK